MGRDGGAARLAGLRAGRLQVEVVSPPSLRAPGLAAWLTRVAPARARGQLVVALASDARVARLNAAFRQHPGATDVLSFPGDPPYLGDVVIARGIARRQARQAGHSLNTEVRVLALHGLLHLLGYDHERDDGQMARLEHRLRRKGGLVEGLIERAGPASRVSRRRPRAR